MHALSFGYKVRLIFRLIRPPLVEQLELPFARAETISTLLAFERSLPVVAQGRIGTSHRGKGNAQIHQRGIWPYCFCLPATMR